MRILLVEDNLSLAEGLVTLLRQSGYAVDVVHDGASAEALAMAESFDLVILDLNLPQMDGLEVCRELRSISQIPFIISSARSDIADKLIGLERGADDYLPKPYDPRELVARIHTILRRYKHPLISNETSRLKIDDKKMQAFLDGEVLELTLAEFEILKLLCEARGSVLSRDYIAENVSVMRWESGERSIDVVVSRIRKKLGDNPKNPEFIKSVKGAGYKFVG